MNNTPKLTRRAGQETRKTYWLEVADKGGFLRVHTSSPYNHKRADPELVALAAVVAVAPELAGSVAALLDVIALKAPHALNMPECQVARELLATAGKQED